MSTPPGKPASNSPSGQEQWQGSSPGERLQNARQALQLDVREVAEQLNLAAGVVRALEADDYRLLPNAIFVRGYLRSYARIVGLDGDELVRGYDAITGYQPKKIVPVSPPLISDPRKSQRNLLLVLVILALIGAAAWLLGNWNDTTSEGAPLDEPAQSQTPDTETGAAESMNPPLVITRTPESTEELMAAAQAVEEPVEDELSADETGEAGEAITPAAEPAPASTNTPAASTPAASTAPAVVTEPAPVASTAPLAQADGGSGLLNLRFQGECWVEVRDGSGKMVFSSLKRAGEEVTLRAATPIHVKLGNGDVVNVQYNRQAVSFATRPDRKVVRLTLGE